MYSNSVIGVEKPNNNYPRLILLNKNLFEDCHTFLDIGAGRGRFIKLFFKEFKLNIHEYIAVEPYHESVLRLKELRQNYDFEIIQGLWECVREKLIHKKFDVLIIWNVAMFMDLRRIHNTESYLEAILREIPVWVSMTRKYILFSLYPVKNGLIDKKDFKVIFREFEKYCEVVGRYRYNRIFRVNRLHQ